MRVKRDIAYLIQLLLPFTILGLVYSSFFFLPLALILISLPFESMRKQIITAWQMLGIFLARITSPIILSLVYYFALTPLALLRRLSREDPLVLKRPETSNFKDVSQLPAQDSFEKLW